MNAFFATLYCHVKLEKLEKVLKKMLGKKWTNKNKSHNAEKDHEKKRNFFIESFVFLYISESKIEKLIDCLRIDPVTLRSAL